MRILIGGVAAVLAVVVIGCGGGGDTTEVAVTKAQFIKRGDQICRTAQKKKEQAIVAWREKAEKEGKGELGDYDPAELGRVYLTVALPPVKQAAEELAALNSPAEDAKAEKLVESMTSAVEAIEEEPTRGVEGAPYGDVDKLAQAYGFKTCGLF